MFGKSRLEKLGIERTIKDNVSHYAFSLNGDTNDPKRAKKHYRRIINAVTRDARKMGGLERMTVSVESGLSDIYALNAFLSDELHKARKRRQKREDFGDYFFKEGPLSGDNYDMDKRNNNIKAYDNAAWAGGGIGAIVAGAYGLYYSAEFGSFVADRIGDSPYLTGIGVLAQYGIPAVAAMGIACVGFVVGIAGATLLSYPVAQIATRSPCNVAKYEAFDNALLRQHISA